jgi:hypothetical protein
MLGEIAGESYRIYVPGHYESEWGPPIISPPGTRVEMCMDRRSARRLQRSVRESYVPKSAQCGKLSVFGAYGLKVPDEYRMEAEGMSFLARQADHISDLDHYLFVLLLTAA